MIKKEYYTELDIKKKDYYNEVARLQSEAVKYFQIKNREKIMEALNKIADNAAHAYDIEMYKESCFALGLTSSFYGHYREAIKYFKYAVLTHFLIF